MQADARGIILLVDDDADIVDAVRDALEPRGYYLIVAQDGADAIRVLDSIRVDLVLLDLVMPRMAGWEFLEARTRRACVLPIPVVVVSAADEAIRMTPRRLYDSLLPKPFRLGELVAIVEHFVSRPRSDDGSLAGPPTRSKRRSG